MVMPPDLARPNAGVAALLPFSRLAMGVAGEAKPRHGGWR
jgi:hypothetical protein